MPASSISAVIPTVSSLIIRSGSLVGSVILEGLGHKIQACLAISWTFFYELAVKVCPSWRWRNGRWDQNCRRTLLTQLTDRFFGRNSPSHGIFSWLVPPLRSVVWPMNYNPNSRPLVRIKRIVGWVLAVNRFFYLSFHPVLRSVSRSLSLESWR